MERRLSTLDLEIRSLDGTPDKPVIAGYAAVFNQLSDDLGGFREKIAPGAFTKSLGNDVRALFNHDSNLILGRTKSKTLRLSEDPKGLAIEIDPPDTEAARDLLTSIKRGDVSQMSFGFFTRSDIWEDIGGKIVRTLIDVDLFDVSPVTFPSFPQTAVAVRALADFRSRQHSDPGLLARMKMLGLLAGI
jgi:HK97 family phage prohead protease